MFFSFFNHSTTVYQVPTICVMISVCWVNRKVLKNSFFLKKNNSLFLYPHTEMEEWGWVEVTTSCSSCVTNCQSLYWGGGWGAGDNAIIYIVFYLGGAISNFSLAICKDSLTNIPSSGVRTLLAESNRKHNFNWLKPSGFLIYILRSLGCQLDSGYKWFCKGHLHFLLLPSRVLTSFHLVVLSSSRFSTEGNNSKPYILFLLRLRALAAAPTFSLEVILSLHWLALMPAPEPITVPRELPYANKLGPGWCVPLTPEVDVELPPEHMV